MKDLMINKESFQIQKLSEFSEFKIKYCINFGRENLKKYKRKIVELKTISKLLNRN